MVKTAGQWGSQQFRLEPHPQNEWNEINERKSENGKAARTEDINFCVTKREA